MQTSPSVAEVPAAAPVPRDRSLLLLFIAGALVAASFDEYFLAWTGNVAPQWIGRASLLGLIAFMWFGRNLSMRIAAVLSFVGLGVLVLGVLLAWNA